MSSIFCKQINLSINISRYIPPPSYYNKNGKEYLIISTHCNERRIEPGIYKYNLKDNTFELLCQYSSTFKPQFHGQVFDERNSKLYLIGSNAMINGNGLWSFDLETNNKLRLCEKCLKVGTEVYYCGSNIDGYSYNIINVLFFKLYLM